MRKTILVIWILVAIVIVSTGSVTAQDNCGNLSSADCAFLMTSEAIMQNTKSAVFRMDMEMTFSDTFGLMADEPFALRIIADGAYTLDLPQADETATMLQFMDGALRGINTDMTIIISLTDPTQPSSDDVVVTLDMRMVDGIFYFNGDKLDESLAGAGWQGFDLAGFFSAAIAQLEGMLNLPIPESSESTTSTLMGYGGLVRAEDDTINGKSMAAFEDSVILSDYTEDPVERALILDALEDAIRSNAPFGYSDSEREEAAEAYLAMFENLQISLREYVGLDDNYLYRMELSLDFHPEPGAMSFDAPDPMGIRMLAFIDFGFTFALDLNQFDDAPFAVAPPDATLIPLDELLRELGQLGDSAL
jgi:hypothetical protein